jgi:FAD dependent oxidoreductase TIGR03364
MRLVIVGGGIIGTTLALAAVDLGHEVVQLEREHEPRGATVRNFGLLWICGRAEGRELDLALAGRGGWQRIAADAPDVGLRETGCLLVLRSAEEVALAQAACRRADAERRGFRVVEAAEARDLEPALQGSFAAALHSPHDALVEPRVVLPALRALAAGRGRYTFVPGRTVVDAGPHGARDHTGEVHDADAVALCPGDAPELIPAPVARRAALRVRRLQMLEAVPASSPPRMALASGDAMRYYPAFDLPERALLPPASAMVSEYATQLLVAPRRDGSLTIGDTHVDDEPGAFGSDEPASMHLIGEASSLLGDDLVIRRRWTGSYVRRTDGGDPILVDQLEPGLVLATAAGGLGMTAAPAIAAEVAAVLGL